MLFDRYILKTGSRKETDGRWAILMPATNQSKTVFFKDTFGKDGSKHKKYNELEIIQPMFHVSFNTKTDTKWLYESLVYLYQNQDIEQSAYLHFLE